MSEFQINIPLAGSEYNEILMAQKRGDQYEIVLGQIGKDGNFYMRWTYPQRRVDGKNVPSEKAIPHKIPLGNLVQAHSAVDALKRALPPLPVQEDEDDIGF